MLLTRMTLSLLGIVRHLAKVERVWFRQRVAGEAVEPLYAADLGKDADFNDTDPSTADTDLVSGERDGSVRNGIGPAGAVRARA